MNFAPWKCHSRPVTSLRFIGRLPKGSTLRYHRSTQTKWGDLCICVSLFRRKWGHQRQNCWKTQALIRSTRKEKAWREGKSTSWNPSNARKCLNSSIQGYPRPKMTGMKKESRRQSTSAQKQRSSNHSRCQNKMIITAKYDQKRRFNGSKSPWKLLVWS